MAAEETFQPFYNITVPETGKSYRISQQAYEQGADSLFRNYPNAQVTRVSLSGADDDDINERDQFQVKMDDGSFQTVSAQKYGAKKDQMFRDFPDAEVYKVSDMSYQRYKPLMDEQRQALEDFRSGNSDFMREYEERLGRLQSVRGDVRGNEQFEADSAFVHDNAESYRGFKQRGEELAREYYNNPLVIRERREGAEMSKTLSEQFRESGKNAETWAEKRDWARAAKLMEDVQKLYEAPGEFDKDKDRNNILHALQSYWKGTKDKFGDTDIYIFGIAEILRNLSVYGINKRIEEAEEKKGGDLSEQEIDRLVTPAEKALLQSVSQLAKAQSDRDDINGAYLAGQGFMESIPFMADFIISGGYGSATGKLIGKGAQKIAKEGTRKALLSWLGRSLMTERDILKAERAGMKLSNLSDVVGATGKKAARYINWADEAVAEPLIKGLWHTAAPMSPTGLRGWTNITENLLQTDDQGNMMSFGRAWWKGTLDTMIENWSESVGGALEKGMALPFKGLGWVGEKTIGKGSLGRWARWLYEATPTQLFKEAGFNGMIGEMAEEWVGNMARVATGVMSTEEFADFASWKQQLEMAASFAPLSLFGLGTGAIGAKKKANRWKQLSEDVKGILRKQGVSDEEINNIFNTKYDTAEDIAKKFVPYVGAIQKQAQSGDNKQAKKDYQKMLDFAWATGERMIFDEWNNIEKSYNRQQAGLEIADRLGRDFTTTDKDGNKRVTRIVRPDGMTGYAVAESDEDGLRAVVWDDGSTGFTRVSPDGVDEDGNAISKILPSQSEDEYLDGYIAEKKRAEEAARIEEETRKNSMELAKHLEPETEVNLGTVENPVRGKVLEAQGDGVVIASEDGSTQKYPFERVADMLGLPLKPKTEEELEAERLATEERRDKKQQTLNDSLAGGSKIPVVDGFEAVRFLPAQTDQDGNTRFPVMLRAVDTQGNAILPGRSVETGEDGQTGVVYLTENEMDRLIAAMPLGERAARYNGIQQGTELDVSYPSGEEGEVITEKIRFTRAVVEDGQLMLYGINEKGDEVSVTEDMVTNLPGVVETDVQEPVKADGNLENEDNSQMDDKDPLADYRYQSEATGQMEVDSDRLWRDNPKEWCRWNDTENTDPDKVTSREKLQWALGELDKKIKKLTDAIREGNLKGMDRTKKDNLRKDRNALSGRHDELQSLMELYPEKKAESHTVEASEDAQEPVKAKSIQERMKALGDYLNFKDFVLRTLALDGVKFKWGNSKNGEIKGLGAHLGFSNKSPERNQRIWLLNNKEGKYPEAVADELLEAYAEELGVADTDAVPMDGQSALDVLLEVVLESPTRASMVTAAESMHADATGGSEMARQQRISEDIEALAKKYGLDAEFVADVVLGYIDTGGLTIDGFLGEESSRLSYYASDDYRADREAEDAAREYIYANFAENDNNERQESENEPAPGEADEGNGLSEVRADGSEMVGGEPDGLHVETSGQQDAAGYGGSRESGQEGHSDVQQPLHTSVSDTSAGGTGEAGAVAGSDEDLPFDESGNYVGDAAGEVETGPFGRIFRQFAGKAKEAVRALIENKGGEAIGALSHPEIGAIDLVWGEEGTGKSDGFGLSKLLKYHPEVVENLQEILDDMVVVSRTENRVQLESERYKATVRLTWDEQRKTWLLTAFEKKNSALDNTTDTGGTSNGSERNDTATPQDTVSSDKDSENSSKASESEESGGLTDAQKNVLGWLDGKSPEQVEREYEEKRKAEEKALEESEKTRKKVEDRIAKWKKLLGDVFEVHTDISTVTDKQAIREIEEDGSQVNGWYDPATGKAHLYIPHILKDENPLSRVDKTILHECLAHKGVRGIFKTEEQLNDFFDKVWKMMENYTWGGVPAREHFIGYVGGTGTFATEQEAQRAAADEFVAHCAEADEAVIKEMDSNFWTRLLDFIKDIFKASAGMDIFEEEGANPFADIIRQSLSEFVKARRESEAKQREEQALQETKEDVLSAIDGEETKATSTRKAQDNPQIAVSQTQEKYEDFGEKIGMARKDTAVSGIKRGDADGRPSWAKKYNTVNVRMLSDEEMAQRQRLYLGYHSKNFDEVISDISKGTDFNQPFVGFWDEEKKTAFGKRTIRHYITGEGGKPIIFQSQAQFEATMPVFEASRSGFRVIAYKDGKFRIAKQASNGKYVEYAEFDSREDAVAYLSSPEGATDLLNRKRENYELPALEELTRNGMPDYRNGKDVTPDDFQSAFGFRGGEFGNWLNAEERKQFLNYAYDALMDLATILHISPRALSLGGELSIAFGARGKQGAKAHYEPTRAVINLTKMNGAGSLAHEWAHALDNYFGMMDARQERIRDEKQGDKNDHYLSRERSYQKGAREEVRNAFKEVMDVLTHKMEERAIVEEKEQEQLDKRRNWLRREVDFARKRLEMGRTTYDYNRKTKKREEVKHTMTEEQLSTFDKLASELESDPTFKYDWDFSRDQHRGMGETADKLRELVKEIMPDRKSDNPLDNIFHQTDLLRKQAERLQAAKDGKTETLRVETTVLESSKWFDRGRASAYYSKPIEMFARAFETYVAGEMKAGVQSSDYLTYEKSPLYMAAWGKSPYPMGEERVAAKAAFDKLFQTIREKTDEQTGKQVLFSKKNITPDSNEEKRRINNTADKVISFFMGIPIKKAREMRLADEAKRKEAAAEIYGRVLNNQFDSVTLRLINEYIDNGTPKNPYGRRISKRLPQEVERGLYEGARTNAVDALLSRISEGAVPPSRRNSPSERRRIAQAKNVALKGWAIASGNWYTDLKQFTDQDKPFASGSDSDVYVSKEGQYVIKASHGKSSAKKFAPDIDNIPLFNYIFPNTAYEILGYGEIDGKFVRILKQPVVEYDAEDKLSVDERVQYMHELGFEPINKEKTVFSDKNLVVADLQKSNIVYDKAGNVAVIDADVKLHTKDVGGEYTYPPVEEDVPDGTLFSRAYHGTGADFERFDHSHMGEGEGSQVYGWGTYVSTNRETGLAYARSIGGSDDQYERAIRSIENQQARDKESLAKAKTDAERRYYEDAVALADQRKEQMKRHLYTVEIPDDNGQNYLHWNEPLTREQSRKIIAAVKERAKADGEWYEEMDEEIDSAFNTDAVGAQVEGTMDYFLGDKHDYSTGKDPGAERNAKILRSIGIVGIQIPVDRNGGKRFKGSNYVIFDEKDLEITDHLRFSKTAPNGNPSNLSDKQWNMVRTPQFKKWFGDWELAGKMKIIEEAKTITVSKHSLGDKELEQAYQSLPNGVNKYDGRNTEFINNTYGKIIKHKGVPTSLIVPQLKEIYDASVPIFSESEEKKEGHKEHPNFVGYHHYLAKIDIDGKPYYVRLTVQELKTNPSKKKADGFTPNQFHSSFISDVELYENTAGTPIKTPGTSPAMGVSSGISDAKLQQFFESAKDAEENCSKVVDENGEPLVVEHATNNDFTEFDINHLGENSHDKGLFGAGFYFGTHAPGWMFGSKNVMRVFLDIKKPFEILESVSGSRGAFYEYLVSKFDIPTLRSLQLTQYGNNINFGDYIDIIKSVNAEIAQGLHDEELANDEELQFYYPEDRMEVYRDRLISKRAGNFGTLANSMGYIIGEAIGSEEFSDAIKKAGYDGVIVDRGNNYKEYVAFEPNQIKSATENNGDFNPNNPDIRFSLVAPEGSSREQVLAAAAKAMPKTKVVDRYGRPRVVYHGTASEAPFNTFSYDEDFYFMTTSRGTAEQYTRKRGLLSVRPGQAGRIMPVFVNLENPYIVDANRRNWDNIPVGWKATPATADEIARYAKENGYDGVIIKRVRDNMFNNDRSYADDIIAFDPIQIKSAGPKYELRKREHFPWDEYESLTSEVGDTFDDNGNKIPLGDRFDFDYNDDIRFSRSNDNQRIFISNAEASLGRVKMDKATPQQWLAMLEKEGGLKAGEDKWLGLSDWLRSSDKKTLTKQEVLDFIRKNEIVIEEVHYIENAPGFEELKAEYDKWLHDEGYDFAHEQLIDRFGDDAEIAFDDLGGELTVANEEAASSLLGSENLINLTRLDYTTSGLKDKHEIALTVPTIEPYNEHDTIHFGDAGEGRAVAWSRFGDAHDEDGRKVLFIDEIQSKRHQDGREYGYRDESIKEEEKRVGEAYNAALDAQRELTRELDEKYGGTKGWTKTVDISRNGFVNYRIVPDSEKLTADEYAAYIRNKEEIERTTNLIDELQKKYRESGFVPTAPFEKNWHELAMKRMLRLAAEEGYDYVAWTTGEQQAERYNIGGAVDSIGKYDQRDNEFLVEINMRGGQRNTVTVDGDGNIKEANHFPEAKTLSDIVGKELAIRILALENGEEIKGDGLRIGGEGMKGFYDEILPRFMNKYGKKWGVKVEEINFPELGDEGITAHAVRVTPEMKESVMQGQLMFSRKFSPEEIAEMETPILESKGTFKNLSEAEDWAKMHLQGKSYTNKSTNESVYIGNKSISEMLDEESAKKIDIELHKAALMSVPEFITDGIPAEIHPDTHGRDFDVMRLYSAIKLNDDIYRVKSTVRRVKQGDRYYTYELQEMELTEERPQTGKGEEHSPHNPNSSVNSISGAKLLKGVKKTNSSETILPENSNTRFSRSRRAVEKVSKDGIGALVGKDNVGDLLANIYEVLPLEVRRDIVANAERSGWNIHESVATYISELAARGFENDESGTLRAVAAIMDYYAKDGGGYDDNTQRYLLWKIGQPSTDDILAFISDVAMRNRWNVGRPEQDGNIRFSLSDNLEGQKAAADAVVDDAKESFDTKKKALKGDLLTAAKAMATQKEYDKSTVEAVTRLAKTLLKEQGIDRMSRLEVGRLLGIVTTSVGKSPRIVKRNADALVDIIIDHLIRLEQSRLDNLANTKASRTNTTGVEVQGALDLQGQNTLKAFKAGLDMQIGKDVDETDGTTIIGRMNILSERMDSEDDTVSSEARAEYDGLALAKEYLENVSESRSEEVAIRNEMKDAAEKRRAGEMTAGQYSAFVVEAEHAIRENRIERIEALRELQLKMQGIVSGSRDAAAEFREREKQRIEEIHHLANSDMQGTSASAFEKPRFLGRLANTSLVRFFASSLASFDQFLRMLGRKNIRGEGYLWSKFMRGWEKATENAYLGQRDAKKELDDKVSEVFDKDGMRWSDLYEIERKMPTATVKWWDGGEMKEHELTQGQLLYIYMVNKMSDGRMKLRRMGIEEEHVQAIVRQMDDRFLQLADWMQGEFLVKLRNKYNAVHERLFGASMAAIDDYFPLKINKRSLNQQEDIGRPDLDDSLPATTTGSIIKRKRNSQDLDLPNADAFSVMIEHIDQMEQWAAFAEFNKDLNTLLSYKRFRNQVKNTTSIYGTGDQLWEKFKNICRIAGGTYRPKVKKESLDAAAVNLAKGVTMAKISFRVYTALKQFLSMPAFVSDANIGFLVQDMVNPAAAWRWAMENLPLVEKRWKSRQAGDSRLLQTETDWKLWKNKVVEWSGRIGMTPNAFVDAVTVSIGAHAMYRTRYNEYIKDGYSEEEADRKAKEDATILYNETQQSNEGAFLSDIQLDRTVFSTMITVFRNSSMGYQRQLHDALRGLGRMMRKGYKAESIEFMSKQMVRDGLTEEQALHAANRQYNKAIVRNVVRVGTFGFLVQFAWNLGSSVVYLLFGDDDDKKKEMLTDAAIKAMLGGSVEGLAGGNVLSEMLSLMANGKGLGSYNPTMLPLISDMKSTYQKFSNDWVAGVNDLINLAVQAGFGFNPQTFEDAIVAVVDAAGGNMDISKEAMMFALRVIQVPQSQLDELLIDELNLNGKNSDEMDYWDVAERYARYKLHRNAPVTGWLYSDEAEQNREDKYLKQFNKKVRAREELIYGEEED